MYEAARPFGKVNVRAGMSLVPVGGTGAGAVEPPSMLRAGRCRGGRLRSIVSGARLVKWRRHLGKWTAAIAEVIRLAPPRARWLVCIGTFLSSVLGLLGLTMMVPLIIAATDLKEFDQAASSSPSTSCPRPSACRSSRLPILTLIIVGLGLKALVVDPGQPLRRARGGPTSPATCGSG